jgi:hypothetical protein
MTGIEAGFDGRAEIPAASTGRPAPGLAWAGAGDSLFSARDPLQIKKLHVPALRFHEISSFPVNRHQDGKSCSTETSVERT